MIQINILTLAKIEGDYYTKTLRDILTLPYLYYVTGVGSSYFWLYLDKYMEEGDVLEIVMIHNINRVDEIVEKMLEKPSSIHLNVGSLTYKNEYGTFQLHQKNWIEDAKHRKILTEHGVTTIRKY